MLQFLMLYPDNGSIIEKLFNVTQLTFWFNIRFLSLKLTNDEERKWIIENVSIYKVIFVMINFALVHWHYHILRVCDTYEMRIAWMIIGAVTFDCCTLNAFWCVIALFHFKQKRRFSLFVIIPFVCCQSVFFSSFSWYFLLLLLLLLADEFCYVMTEPFEFFSFHIAQTISFLLLVEFPPNSCWLFFFFACAQTKQAYLFVFSI